MAVVKSPCGPLFEIHDNWSFLIGPETYELVPKLQ